MVILEVAEIFALGVVIGSVLTFVVAVFAFGRWVGW